MYRVRLAHRTVTWHQHLGFALLILGALQVFWLVAGRSGSDRPFTAARSARSGNVGLQQHGRLAATPPPVMLWTAPWADTRGGSYPASGSEGLHGSAVPFAGLLDVGLRRHSRFPSRLQIRVPFNLLGNTLPAFSEGGRSARQSREGSIVRNFGSTFTPQASVCAILTVWVC